MPPQFFEQILRLGRQAQLARGKASILQIRTINLVVDVEQTREVHRAGH